MLMQMPYTLDFAADSEVVEQCDQQIESDACQEGRAETGDIVSGIELSEQGEIVASQLENNDDGQHEY